VLKGGAHHLELRTPNDLDPQDVKDVREQVISLYTAWIKEWNGIQSEEEPLK